MQLPQSLIYSLQDIRDFDESSFINIHDSQQELTSIRINPAKVKDVSLLFKEDNIQLTSVPWARDGYYLSQRPSFTFDPLFHAGCYYVQEASSMFIEQALLQTVNIDQPLKVLDLCAAPGGKSTHLQSLLSKESLLVSNEVIHNRTAILKDNIIKWGTQNVVVTQNDPKDFLRMPGFFDVMLVDAPCSGSGLFRRDEKAIATWSENNVSLCSSRQQRILSDALPALMEGGILIYATCSYSKDENENVVDWISRTYDLESISLNTNPAWGITTVTTEHDNCCYRFWPYQVKGEGFFISVFIKKSGSDLPKLKNNLSINRLNKKEELLVKDWIKSEEVVFLKNRNEVYAWPEYHFPDMSILLQNLRVLYSGILVGEIVRDKIIPAHALTMTNRVSDSIYKTALDKTEAIKYLQKKELNINGNHLGWQLATYQNYPLGWMNVLPNRINNYYPKELRILKTNPN